MEVVAKAKYIRISPKKARPVANLIRGKKATESLIMLQSMAKKPAELVSEVLKSAMANAENNFNLEKTELVISEITVDGGPVLKRFRPRARGGVSSLKKRTSHITVVVSGDVKTKRSTGQAQEKQALAKEGRKETKIEAEDEHKIEVEKPASLESDSGKPNFVQDRKTVSKTEFKSKFFRRKTG